MPSSDNHLSFSESRGNRLAARSVIHIYDLSTRQQEEYPISVKALMNLTIKEELRMYSIILVVDLVVDQLKHQ